MVKTNKHIIFPDFIHRLRRQQKLTLKQLSEGLCSPETIASLENGELLPNKLLQDFILDRLGVGAEDYEHLLPDAEYQRWAARQRILHYIARGDMAYAGQMLSAYKAEYDISHKPERQFYLSMYAQIRRCMGATEEELSVLFMETLTLTAPTAGHAPLACLVLSAKELNLLLEAEHYRREGERPARYREVLDYLEQKQMDRWNMAKIYPKAVYFLCRAALDKGEREPNPETLLKYCARAIKILRNSGRGYFLCEILELQERLLKISEQKSIEQGAQKNTDSLRFFYQQISLQKELPENTYVEYEVTKGTFDYCYLYVEKRVSCLNDAIRIRRKMLGMSRRELAEGICDIKTLERLERKQTKTHLAIVQDLLAKLRLPADHTRTELATSNHRVRELMANLRMQSNEKNWDKAAQLHDELQKLAPAGIVFNRQALRNKEILIRWKKKEISNEEYVRQMRETLELTLPFNAFLKEGEKYLTYEEQRCILNMMEGMDPGGPEYDICMQHFTKISQAYTEELTCAHPDIAVHGSG